MAPRARPRSAQRYIPVTLGPRSPRPCLPWTLSATSGAFTFSLLKQCFGGGQRRLLRRRFRQRLLCGEQVIGPATVGLFLPHKREEPADRFSRICVWPLNAPSLEERRCGKRV